MLDDVLVHVLDVVHVLVLDDVLDTVDTVDKVLDEKLQKVDTVLDEIQRNVEDVEQIQNVDAVVELLLDGIILVEIIDFHIVHVDHLDVEVLYC